MMRFKKMVAILLAAALALTMLTACGGGGGGSKSSENQKLTVEINKELTKAGFTALQYSKELDQKLEKYIALMKLDKTTASKEAGIDTGEYVLEDVTITKEDVKVDKLVEAIEKTIGIGNKTQEWGIGYYAERDSANEENVIVHLLMKKPTSKK